MKKMILLILIMVALAIPFGSNSVRLRKSGQDRIDWQYKTCYYKKGYKWSISIVVRGMCPYAITYFPETGHWRR